MNIQRFTLGELWTNCYVIWDSNKDGFIVDPGGDAKKVKKFVEDNGIKIKYIFLTHGHADHIGGLADVRPLSENGVAIHSDDSECLTNADKNISRAFGYPFIVQNADVILADDDKLQVGKLCIDVMHTPGHTAGGVCFYVTDGNDKLLLCGDTLFARSIGRTDLLGGDENKLINSLKKLNCFEDDLPVYPGHGPATTIGEEKKYNPYWPK